MTLRTGEDILIWRRRLWIALYGGIVLEEALDLSSDRILSEWIDEKSAFSQPHSFLFSFLSFPHTLIFSSIYIWGPVSFSVRTLCYMGSVYGTTLTGWHTNHLGPCSARMRSQDVVVLYVKYEPPTGNFDSFRLIYVQFGIVCAGL